MKAKVLMSFIDSDSKVIQTEGKVIELTEERFTEINNANDKLLKEVKEEGNAEQVKRKTKTK